MYKYIYVARTATAMRRAPRRSRRRWGFLDATFISKAPQGNERGAMGSKKPPAF